MFLFIDLRCLKTLRHENIEIASQAAESFPAVLVQSKAGRQVAQRNTRHFPAGAGAAQPWEQSPRTQHSGSRRSTLTSLPKAGGKPRSLRPEFQ